MNKLFARALLLGLIAVLVGALAGAMPTLAQDDQPYWPTGGWRTSTPEEQGIDSARLAEMFEAITDNRYAIHSLLIVRNGYLVAEMYRYPYEADTLHELRSGTKSFTSTLIGMAIERGDIAGVDQPVIDFFPEREIANLDDNKRAMTLENLLTMSGGFDWPGGMLEQPSLRAFFSSPDWVQFMLDRPVSYEPGTQFTYNSGGSHLLSAIFQTATGLTAESFAAEHLFAPLSITDWYWRSDPQGISSGGWGLWLTPRDMAKFGYLYLKGGQWDGQPVVPADWAAAATRQQIKAGGQWLSEGYGYQWWVDQGGYYMALGYGGQYIIVMPDRDMVVAVTSGLSTNRFFVPEQLFNTYILPASESSAPLPPNPEGVDAMTSAIAALAAPAEAVAPPPLPEIAQAISGETYLLDSNETGFQSVALTFSEGQDTAAATLDGVLNISVGLDRVYRLSYLGPSADTPDVVAIVRGRWVGDDRFVIEYHELGRPEHYIYTLLYKDDKIRIRVLNVASGISFAVNGQMVE